MSDTPRTDKEIYQIVDQHDKWGKELHVDADFARTLERENAQLRKEREELINTLRRFLDGHHQSALFDDHTVLNDVLQSSRKLLAKLEGGR